MFSCQVRPREIDERREQAPARPDQRRDREPAGPAAPAALHPPAAIATAAHGPCVCLRQEIQLLSTRFVIPSSNIRSIYLKCKIISWTLDGWLLHKLNYFFHFPVTILSLNLALRYTVSYP